MQLTYRIVLSTLKTPVQPRLIEHAPPLTRPVQKYNDGLEMLKRIKHLCITIENEIKRYLLSPDGLRTASGWQSSSDIGCFLRQAEAELPITAPARISKLSSLSSSSQSRRAASDQNKLVRGIRTDLGSEPPRPAAARCARRWPAPAAGACPTRPGRGRSPSRAGGSACPRWGTCRSGRK